MATIKLMNAFDEVVEERHIQSGETLATELMRIWPNGFPEETVFVIGPDGTHLSAEDACVRRIDADETYILATRPQFGAAVVGALAGGAVPFLAKTAFLGITWGQLALTAVSLIGSWLLAPKLPKISEPYQWADEQPQFFSAQSNRLRVGQRVPDVFGVVRVWPDLIQEPWLSYAKTDNDASVGGDTQSVEELYVISNGRCELTNLRVHDEVLPDNVMGAPELFIPDTDPNATNPTWPGPVWISNALVGNAGSIELRAPNDDPTTSVLLDLNTNGTITATDTGGTPISNYFDNFSTTFGEHFALTVQGTTTPLDPANQLIYEVVSASGSTMTVSPSPGVNQTGVETTFRGIEQIFKNSSGSPVLYSGTWNLRYNWVGGQDSYNTPNGSYSSFQPTFTGETFTAGVLFTPGSAGTPAVEEPISYDPTTFTYSSDVAVDLGPRFTRQTHATGTLSGYYLRWSSATGYNPEAPSGAGPNITQAYTLPGTSNRIQIDIEFPAGLYQQKKSGGAPEVREVEFNLWWAPVTTNPTWQYVTKTVITSPRRTSRRFTLQKSNIGSGEWQVALERITDRIQPDDPTYVSAEDARMIGVRGRQTANQYNQDEIQCSLARVNLTSTDAGIVVQERALSGVASRWLPNYRTSGNEPAGVSQGHLFATAKIYDAVLFTLIDQGGYDISRVDRDELWSIQEDLDNVGDGSAGEFHGIVDQDMSPEDQARLICNVGRIIMYRRGSVIHFARLKAGLAPRYLFNARNKAEPEVKTLNFGDSNEATSVIIRYMDAEDDYKERSVQYPGENEVAQYPDYSLNPEEQSVIGITNYATAWRAAKYAWDRREYSRDIIDLVALDDGLLCSPGDVIAVTDHLRTEKPIDGEVIDVTGNDWTFDRTIPAGSYVARVTDRAGNIEFSSTITTTTEDTSIDMSTASPPWTTLTAPVGASTTGLRYTFTPDVRDQYDLYYVAEMTPDRDGPVRLQCVVYRDEAFAADTATPPDKPTGFATR